MTDAPAPRPMNSDEAAPRSIPPRSVSLDRVLANSGLSTFERDAVERAYAVFRAHHGRFITAVAADILDDLRADVIAQPDTRVVFLGRDGYGYALAVRALDPVFYAEHCSEVVVSRVAVEAALQDREQHGAKFAGLDAFRSIGNRVNPADVPGAYRALTRYLNDAGVPIDQPGAAVVLVDNSFKGTIQELLSAAYPTVTFTGRYALHSAHPDDPHPGTKRGYVFHQEASQRWQGAAVRELPDAPAETFGCIDAIRAIEDTLNGPMSSPTSITAAGPVQVRDRDDPVALRGLNLAVIAPEFRSRQIRELVKTAALIAVEDAAVDAAQRWRHTHPQSVTEERRQAYDHFTEQVRSWISRDSSKANIIDTTGTVLDPALAAVLDSFVVRGDVAVCIQLATALDAAGASSTAAEMAWSRLASAGSMDAKRHIVATVTAWAKPEPGTAATSAAGIAATTFTPPRGPGRRPATASQEAGGYDILRPPSPTRGNEPRKRFR